MVKNILPLKLKRFPIYLYSELDLHSRMEICSSDTLTNELYYCDIHANKSIDTDSLTKHLNPHF